MIYKTHSYSQWMRNSSAPLTIILFLIIISFSSSAQIITTVAGDGTTGYTGDGGPATTAKIGYPGYIAFDNYGNYYISELNNTIRKVSTSGTITTIVGNGTTGNSSDGVPATAAQFNFSGQGGVVFDKYNNLFFTDRANNKIRKVDATTGIVTTIAGTGIAGYAGDNNAATSALLSLPVSLAYDTSGDLYISDGGNYVIRKINSAGVITTIAGNGISGFSGDNGPATAANITPAAIRLGNHNDLYFADGLRVRKINLTTGIINTLAGSSVSTFSGDGGQATAAQFSSTIDVTLDFENNIYVSDGYDYRIRKIDTNGIINTIVGNGVNGYYGDGGLATNAELYNPYGIAIDVCGNLYISDNSNHRIRKVSFNSNCLPEGVQNTTSTSSISIYPNPMYDALHLDNINGQTNYRVISITGKCIQSGTLKGGSNSIPVSSLPSGMYMIEVTDNKGTRTITKIIKQ